MAHGLHLNLYRRPQLRRIVGEETLRVAGALLIMVFLLALLYLLLGSMEHLNW
jgi:hypothetical protein